MNRLPRLADRLATTALPFGLALVLAIVPATFAQDTSAADEKQTAAAQETQATSASPSKAEQKQPASKARRKPQQRLDSIEQKLEEIARQLQELTTATPTGPTEKATGQTENTSPKDKQTSGEKPADDDPAGPKATSRVPAERAKLPAPYRLEDRLLSEFGWRSIGPANMSGRITDVVVHDQDPSLWWIATASGGLLKTTNQGVTVEHQFDHESSVSIGCIAADPKNKDIIWVGTGEANPRNSVSYGDGVYKSVDGGKSWTNMGLKDSYQIGRILIDPRDSNTVYVGALGRLYGPNRERGVFKTVDGGTTWKQVLYVDDNTGVIDMIMHPENPDIIIAALWDRMRDGFDSWPGNEPREEGIDGYDPIRKWGPGGGLYRTTDAGGSWSRLTTGLPTGKTGRIGLDWQKNSPHTIYAIIDCEDIGKGPKPFDAYLGLVGRNEAGSAIVSQVMPDSPAQKAGVQVGDVILSADDQAITEFDQLLDVLREKQLGDRLELKVKRGEDSPSFTIRLLARPGSSQSVPTVWLGLSGEDRDQQILVTRVVDGGPAAKAGLKNDDLITEVNGQAPGKFAEVVKQVAAMYRGDVLPLKVQRGDESVDINVTLENRPAPRGQSGAASNAYMGIQGENNEGGGARLTVVTEGGPSADAGLKPGDAITKVDGKPVADYAALISTIRTHEPGDKLKLSVTRGAADAATTLELELTLGDRRGPSALIRPYTYSYYGQQPNVQDQQGTNGHLYGGIYKSTDAGETWQRVNSLNTRPMYFSVVRVDPNDDQRVYVMGVSQFRSSNGGVTFTPDFGNGVHADGHDLWIDPRDGRHMIIAGDGGYYVTYDYGDHWDHINTAAIGQFYHVAISPKQPYWVVGGLQDNGSWGGPAISRTGGSINEDWIRVGGGDGFVCRVDPNDPDQMYFESQNGNIFRRHLKTGEQAAIRPPRIDGMNYRFNWNTPFILSSHNSKMLYSAGNYVFRSYDRGNDMQIISPEITLTGRGSATALSESPRDPDVLYVGTDDGALWVTRDGGHEWKNITGNIGAPGPRWVATIEASRFADGRVYVCLDGHRSDDDNAYVFVSEDFGETFAPLHQGLPRGSTRCLREDVVNENLLYLGTEFALWVSVDRGQSWSQFNQKLPTVAIHEVAIHPTNGEIVVATHGRSLWAVDITPLRTLDPVKLATETLFPAPREVVRWRSAPARGGTNRRYVAQNPDRGAQIWYSIPEKVAKAVIRIEDIEGQVVTEIPGKPEPGMHRVVWNLLRTARPTGQGRSESARSSAGFRGTRGRPVSNGTYRVTLVVDDKPVQSHPLAILRDPELPSDAIADEIFEELLMKDQLVHDLKSRAKSEGRDVWRDD